MEHAEGFDWAREIATTLSQSGRIVFYFNPPLPTHTPESILTEIPPICEEVLTIINFLSRFFEREKGFSIYKFGDFIFMPSSVECILVDNRFRLYFLESPIMINENGNIEFIISNDDAFILSLFDATNNTGLYKFFNGWDLISPMK